MTIADHSIVLNSERIKLFFPYVRNACEFELGVLYFDDDTNDYKLVYDTPVTDDVLGYLSIEDLFKAMRSIFGLPKRIKQNGN